jgi:hypothetical protein
VNAVRAHVLRIADAIGRHEQRPFVIVVDGIDHAARSGAPTDSFLASLVSPAQVPGNVVFLISGQQPEAYVQYPTWLRSPTPEVLRFDLPRLDRDDTLGLVQARLSAAPAPDQENVARDVWDRCEGHTLATVFAVEEAASLSGTLDAFAGVLDARKIAAGIEAYYDQIWTAAVRDLPFPAPARLAACLTLMPTRATAVAVSATMGSARDASVEWGDVLRRLRPLVVEDATGFRVFHNDVRVFLTRILQADPSVYRDCASRLAEHLMTGSDAPARHATAQNLFSIARRSQDVAGVFSPYYVLEGHAIGQTLDSLTEQGITAAEALDSLSPNWDLAHGVAVGLRTLEQLRSSLTWREAPGKRPAVAEGSSSTRLVERRVPPRSDWSMNVLGAALDDLADLLADGEIARATGAFERWFKGLAPMAILTAASRSLPKRSDYNAHESTMAVAKKLGEVSAVIGVLLPATRGARSIDVEAGYARGLLAMAATCERDSRFATILRRVRRFSIPDVQNLLNHIVAKRAWRRCGLLLRYLLRCNGIPMSLRLQTAAVAALLGDPLLRSKYVAPILESRKDCINGAVASGVSNSSETDQLTTMAWIALLFGIEEPQREPSAIRDEIERVYQTTRRDERNDFGVAQVLHAAALLGSLVQAILRGRPGANSGKADILVRTIKALLSALTLGRVVFPLGFPAVASKLIRGFADCARLEPTLFAAVCGIFLTQVVDSGSLGVYTETVWRTLSAAGERQRLIGYADAWLGPSGRGWREAPAERRDLVERLATLLDEIGEGERAAAARARLAWLDIGYTGHKEYVLQQPLAWFEAAVAHKRTAWSDEGLRLFALSREASRTGDNRMSWRVEAAVLTAACAEGPCAVARLIDVSDSALAPGDPSLLRGLAGAARLGAMDRTALMATWAFATGQLCWQSDADRGQLADVREALLSGGMRAGADGLAVAMERAAPAEYSCERDDARASSPDTGQSVGGEEESDVEALRRACDAGEWGRAAIVLRRIVSNRSPDVTESINGVWSALASRAEQRWWFDGATPVYETVFPLLSPEQRWQAVTRAVRSRAFKSPASRTDTLSENLDDICRLAATAEGPASVERGLRRLLQMHEEWLSGGGKLSTIVSIPLADSAQYAGWIELFLSLLFRLLKVDKLTYVEASLRGIYRLFEIDPSACRHLVALARESDPGVLRRFLVLAELLACNARAVEFRAWLLEEMASPRLDLALGAWWALLVGRRALGEREPVWPPHTGTAPLVVRAATPLLVRSSSRTGLLTSVGRASEAVLRHLELACLADANDLRAELSASLRDAPPQGSPSVALDVRVSDMVSNDESEAELDRLFTLLRIRERQGRFERVPISRLAQALMSFADPFVFLPTPRRLSDVESWPIDQTLDGLMLKDPLVWSADLAALLAADLGPHVRLVAGKLRTYSNSIDVAVALDHAVQVGAAQADDRRTTVVNGRASAAVGSPGLALMFPGAVGQEWLTAEVGGLIPFGDATLDFFPALSWQERLGWEPDAANPTVWRREGDRVAWFERLRGPTRRIYSGDFVYRQPTIARWVCTAKEWRRIEDLLGVPQRRVRQEAASLRPE